MSQPAPVDRAGYAAALTLSSSVLLSGMDACIKVLVQDYPALMVAWARFGVMALVLGLIAWRRLGLRLFRPVRPGMQLLRAAAAALATLSLYRALVTLPLAECIAIVFVAPVLTALAASRWLGERVARKTWIVLAGSLAGMLMIVKPGGAMFDWQVVFALLCALGLSGYQVTTRIVAQTDDAWVSMFFVSIVLFAVFSLAMPFAFDAPRSTGDLALMGLVGVLGAMGQLMVTIAFRHGTAAVIAALGYAGIFWSVVFGWLLFDHTPDGWAFAGMAVIAAFGVLLVRPAR